MLGSIRYGLHIQRAALLMRLALGCAAGAFLGSLSLGRLLRFRRLFRLGRLLGFGGHGALRRLGLLRGCWRFRYLQRGSWGFFRDRKLAVCSGLIGRKRQRAGKHYSDNQHKADNQCESFFVLHSAASLRIGPTLGGHNGIAVVGGLHGLGGNIHRCRGVLVLVAHFGLECYSGEDGRGDFSGL